MIDRSSVHTIGTLTPPSESDDASYLDFVEGVRRFNMQKVAPSLGDRYDRAVRQFQNEYGRSPATLEDAHRMLDRVPIFASRQRIWRSGQEMMWEAVIDTYQRREPELLAELARADRTGPGTVRYDPNFTYPDWYDRYDVHLQPGSYHRNPLAGYVYHYGTKVFFQGQNDHDEHQRDQVFAAPGPTDGQVRRVLDLACSCGQSTTAWKERYPQAEVWGIDLSAPMVRYAHKRAAEMGLAIHFAQMAAERLEFPDGHFDIVHAYLLFHEVPVAEVRQIIRESARVLRPGGLLVVYDLGAAQYRSESLLTRHFTDFTVRDNGEPFALAFVELDFKAELCAGGFRDAWDREVGTRTMTVATR